MLKLAATTTGDTAAPAAAAATNGAAGDNAEDKTTWLGILGVALGVAGLIAGLLAVPPRHPPVQQLTTAGANMSMTGSGGPQSARATGVPWCQARHPKETSELKRSEMRGK